MAITGASLNRFRAKVDAVLADFFPATLIFDGDTITGASCPGGRISTDYIDGGESTNYKFPFRIPVASLDAPLVSGDSLDWVVDEDTTLLLEVIESSRRPHEDRYQVTCRHRRA